MQDANDDGEFLTSIQSDLDQAVEALDPEIRFELRRIRARALAGGRRKPAPRFLIPVGFAVTAGLVALVLTFLPGQPTLEDNAAEDIDLILYSQDEMDLYEDLEFYEWLEADA
jgi:hypothetical protein